MSNQPRNPKFIDDEPGAFYAEVSLSSNDHEMVVMDYSIGDEGVLLTVVQGDENISLDMAPSDISALRETLDRCEERLVAEQKALRAAVDGETDIS